MGQEINDKLSRLAPDVRGDYVERAEELFRQKESRAWEAEGYPAGYAGWLSYIADRGMKESTAGREVRIWRCLVSQLGLTKDQLREIPSTKAFLLSRMVELGVVNTSESKKKWLKRCKLWTYKRLELAIKTEVSRAQGRESAPISLDQSEHRMPKRKLAWHVMLTAEARHDIEQAITTVKAMRASPHDGAGRGVRTRDGEALQLIAIEFMATVPERDDYEAARWLLSRIAKHFGLSITATEKVTGLDIVRLD